jgi:large subunit ribosomal protein L10
MKSTGLSRVSKDSIIRQLETDLKTHQTFFVAQHGTISALALDKLRAKLRGTKARYFVVKNTLGKKAFEKANMKDLAANLDGACGIAFTDGDIVASSKVLVDFAKENEVFKIQAAYFNGAPVGADQVKVLASLPPRQVLIARVVGGVQAPISRFVNVLSGTVRQIVTVLDAIAKKKGGA